MNKLIFFYFAFKMATCNCHSEYAHGFQKAKHISIKKTGVLPEKLHENSGLANAIADSLFWIHNDSGSPAELYLINKKGVLKQSVAIPNSHNIDWEDLASDTRGNLYIGDFGNNFQQRKDLTIYKYNSIKTEKITFSYTDQTAFPSPTAQFDCEAFFWYNDSLYLFSKSYERKAMLTKLYVLPDKPGNYQVTPKAVYQIETPVTAAAISPTGSSFALLTYGKLLVFNIKNGTINFNFPLYCIRTRRKQTEALLFVTEDKLLFTNEQRAIFELKLN